MQISPITCEMGNRSPTTCVERANESKVILKLTRGIVNFSEKPHIFFSRLRQPYTWDPHVCRCGNNQNKIAEPGNRTHDRSTQKLLLFNGSECPEALHPPRPLLVLFLWSRISLYSYLLLCLDVQPACCYLSYIHPKSHNLS